MADWLRIRGARQHNLKNFDLDLPRRTLIVITGPSGSGKSSLALDTLFAEGQRRYVESLSAYAKQFLERMEKPAVDSIEGISPAVAIEQKNPTLSSRSTVGTSTEVYDYLRLLWARVGETSCPQCGRTVTPDTVSQAVDRVLELPAGSRILVGFPLRHSERVTHRLIVENLRAMGLLRVKVGSELLDLAESQAADPEALEVDLAAAEVLVVVDRLAVSPGIGERLADSLGTCFAEGEGEAVVEVAGGSQRLMFSEYFRCPEHPDIDFPEPTPQLFSFNNPYGSCSACTGFGATLEYDTELIVPNPSRSLEDGAVDPWTKPRYHREHSALLDFARSQGVSLTAPWRSLPEAFREAVLRGGGRFRGVVSFLRSRERKRYKAYIRVFLRQYQSQVTCRQCGGSRLRREALNVRVAGITIADLSDWFLEDVQEWVEALQLEPFEAQVAASILRELRSRLAFLVEVGLGYLSLGRQTRTLSGGEAQRIGLANSLGATLAETLYVLDEPTVGLHPRDTGALLKLLGTLRDGGNTVVVVEHDAQAIQAADHVVELGPGSGENGGEVVFQGTPIELLEAATITGKYLSGATGIEVPRRRRRVDGPRLVIRGAELHNLQRVDMELPIGALTVVTGVSGSGKSTLVHDVLYRALERELRGGETSAKAHLGEPVGRHAGLEGAHHLEDVVLVDQSPIGRTPRSNPVTYVKAWEEVRRILAAQPLARQRGYDARHFSFNVEGGRCEACKGAGHVEVEMVFMADVYVPCDVCGGKRFKPEVLDVRIRGLNIADVLDLTVDQAIRFFIREDRLGGALWQLQQVGLGYLRLGQRATTLSGGEAQRMKIARELIGSSGRRGRKLYILDEPTTGLAGEDIRKLLMVLERLLAAGHTVLVIEHNLEVIKMADWLVDLGPGAGPRGGHVVAVGRPEDVASVPESVTGRYLSAVLPDSAGQGP